MDYKLQTLPSGLRLLTVPMKGSESVTATVWVKTGSRNEQKEKLGISHFLEHMVFKGSKKYKSMKELFEVFDGMGAIHNASTSKEVTNFYVKLPVTDLERGFDILSDVVLHPTLAPKDMEKEKKVIFEEMKMIKDNPMRHVADIFEELIFSGHPIGMDIIGTEESMNRIRRTDFLSYRDKYYFGENMLVTVAGGVSEAKVLKLTEKYFSGVPSKSLSSEFLPFQKSQKSPQVRINNKKTDQAHFILGFLSPGRDYEYKFAQSVLSTLLGGGASSRLWTEVREVRGLAYAVMGGMSRYSDTGYFEVYTGADITKSYDAIKIILDQCYGLSSKKYKITQKELDKVKGYLQGHLALSLEDSEEINDFFAEQALFDKKIYTPEEMFKKVDAVTLEDVYQEAEKLFKPEKISLAVIGPYTDEEKFAKLLK